MHKPLHKHPVALRHCVILTGIFGLVLLVIFFTHPGCVYGSQTDWSNQHFEIPEYFRTRFYATKISTILPTTACTALLFCCPTPFPGCPWQTTL